MKKIYINISREVSGFIDTSASRWPASREFKRDPVGFAHVIKLSYVTEDIRFLLELVRLIRSSHFINLSDRIGA